MKKTIEQQNKILEIRGILRMLADQKSQSIVDSKRAMELNQFLKELK